MSVNMRQSLIVCDCLHPNKPTRKGTISLLPGPKMPGIQRDPIEGSDLQRRNNVSRTRFPNVVDFRFQKCLPIGSFYWPSTRFVRRQQKICLVFINTTPKELMDGHVIFTCECRQSCDFTWTDHLTRRDDAVYAETQALSPEQ